MFNAIVTTADIYENDQYIGAFIDTKKTKGSLKEYQTVLAVGDTVRGIKEGDLVCVNPTRYMVATHEDKSLRNNIIGDQVKVKYQFNTITLDGKECLMLYDQDISFIIEEFEDVPDIIQAPKKKIIV